MEAKEEIVLTLSDDVPGDSNPSPQPSLSPSSSSVASSYFETFQTVTVREDPALRLIGHSKEVLTVGVLQDGRVVSAAADTTLRVYNKDTTRQLIKLEISTVPYALHVLPDGTLAVGCGDHSIQVFRISEDNVAKRIAVLTGHSSAVFSLTSMTDACGAVILFSGERDGTIKVWDLAAATREVPAKALGSPCIATFFGHTDIVGALLPLQGNLLASGSTDTSIKVWDLTTGVWIHNMMGHSAAVVALQRLLQHQIASASKDRTVRIWNANTGMCSRVLQGHSDSVWGLVRLPNMTLLSGDEDGNLRLWDPIRGEALTTFRNPHGAIHDLEVHPDGTLLVANYTDCSVAQYPLPAQLLAAPPRTLLRLLRRDDAAASEMNELSTDPDHAPSPTNTAQDGEVAEEVSPALRTHSAIVTSAFAPFNADAAQDDESIATQLAAAQAEIRRLRAENMRLKGADFRAQTEVANLKGVIATLLAASGRSATSTSTIMPSTDPAAIERAGAFTAALAEQNARIRELETRNQQAEQRLRHMEQRYRDRAASGSTGARTHNAASGVSTEVV